MTASPWFSAAMVIGALVALSAVASMPIVRAAPLPDGATASGGVLHQPADCSDTREEHERCIPRGPGSPTRPGVPVFPPVTPPEELPKFIWGRAKATLHIKDDDQDVT